MNGPVALKKRPTRAAARAEQQYRVGGVVGQVQAAGVHHGGPDARISAGCVHQLLDVQGNHVAVQHVVALAREPQRIPARATADVGHGR